MPPYSAEQVLVAEQVLQDLEGLVGVLARLQDPPRVGVERGGRLAVVGRRRRHVPVVAGVTDAVRRPQVVRAHRDLAGAERIARRVDVGGLEMRAGHAEVVGPDAVVEVLPGGGPGVRDLRGLAVGRHERAGTEVRAGLAQVVALRLEAPLDDLLGVEPGLGRVLAVLVDGQELGDLADGVVVPRLRRAVGHGVCRCSTRAAARRGPASLNMSAL